MFTKVKKKVKSPRKNFLIHISTIAKEINIYALDF